jgi:pimeloyl-ACP methyl ester carboxylesterase
MVPGGEIYYRSEGSGPPLVLIGGGPSDADTLAPLAGELAPSRTVITYDRRGYSRSRIDDRALFDVELDQDDAGTALDQIAESIGLNRGRSLTGADDRPEVRQDDVELFIRRDVPAIAGYRLDLERIVSVTEWIVVTASEEGRDFYPHRCAVALAAALSTTLIELPGDHAAMISRPAEFAARLTPLIR